MERYNFSRESYPSLLKFLDAVEANESDSEWKRVLPKNVNLLTNLAEFDSKRVVDLTSEPKSVSPDTTLQTNNKSLHEFADAIAEKLKTDGKFTDEMINELKLNYDGAQIKELFDILGCTLDSNLIYDLGFSLVKSSCSDKNIPAAYYQCLLVAKLKEENSTKTGNVLTDFLNHFSQIFCPELSKCLMEIKEDCPRALQENLNNLKSENKQQILREFILNCSKLKLGQFAILEALIVGQMDLGLLKKLVDMLVLSAHEFSADKSFGKLLLHAVQKVEKSVTHFEHQLRNLITNHKSYWRTKILKIFEANIDHSQCFSQTMHF